MLGADLFLNWCSISVLLLVGLRVLPGSAERLLGAQVESSVKSLTNHCVDRLQQLFPSLQSA